MGAHGTVKQVVLALRIISILGTSFKVFNSIFPLFAALLQALAKNYLILRELSIELCKRLHSLRFNAEIRQDVTLYLLINI
jgi:hypothetical protein